MNKRESMIHIYPISAFTDNYIWCLRNTETQDLWVVDPGDAKPVLSELQKESATLKGILITHSHQDHIGGIATLKQQYPSAPIVGPKCSAIPSITRTVNQDASISLWEGINAKVIETPGHLPEHLSYVLESNHLSLQESRLKAQALPEHFSAKASHTVLFCGDTLFSGGCGRIFDGSPEILQASLHRIQQLPDETVLCCTHEYTLANLEFAHMFESDNTALINYRLLAERLREKGLPTLPSRLSLEKAINPFLRCENSRIQDAIESCWAHHHSTMKGDTNTNTHSIFTEKTKCGAEQVAFAKLRKLKDTY